MKVMRVLKAVRRAGDTLTSASVWMGDPLEYTPGKVTRPRKEDGPLAAFSSLNACREFVHGLRRGRVEIWEAAGSPWGKKALLPARGVLLGLWISDVNARRFPSYWAPAGIPVDMLLQDTVLMRTLRLIRCLEVYTDGEIQP